MIAAFLDGNLNTEANKKMGVITINSFQVYAGNSGTISKSLTTDNFLTGLNDTYTELPGSEDNQLSPGEMVDNTFSATHTEIVGTYFDGVRTFIVTKIVGGTSYVLESEDSLLKTDYPDSFDTSLINFASSYSFVCFHPDTLIAGPDGETAVKNLAIGDMILTQDNRSVPVRWIGLQSFRPGLVGARSEPVRIRADDLGEDLPHTDLTVTADHGLILDDLVINASSLVNGTTIDFVALADLPDRVTYFHIETEAHDVILANGTPAETFVDAVTRANFDNYAEYLDLYGAERIIPEMDRPRISSQRLLPKAIKARLGIVEITHNFDTSLTA